MYCNVNVSPFEKTTICHKNSNYNNVSLETLGNIYHLSHNRHMQQPRIEYEFL